MRLAEEPQTARTRTGSQGRAAPTELNAATGTGILAPLFLPRPHKVTAASVLALKIVPDSPPQPQARKV